MTLAQNIPQVIAFRVIICILSNGPGACVSFFPLMIFFLSFFFLMVVHELKTIVPFTWSIDWKTVLCSRNAGGFLCTVQDEQYITEESP